MLVYVFPQLREPTGRWWIDSLLQAVLKSLFFPCNAGREDFETAYPPETAIRIGETPINTRCNHIANTTHATSPAKTAMMSLYTGPTG